jgi:hypothetical protein
MYTQQKRQFEACFFLCRLTKQLHGSDLIEERQDWLAACLFSVTNLSAMM